MQGRGIAGRDERRGARGRELGEAAEVGEHQRPAEGEGGERGARLIDARVRQDDEGGAFEAGRNLLVAREPRHEANAGRGGRSQRVDVHARRPDDPQLRPLDPAR